jgi:hypothetical protein
VADLFELHENPGFADPVLVMGLEGWIDAGYSAALAVGSVLEASEFVTVATFDADTLLDHRSRRPTMHLLNGVTTGLTWPSIELRAALDPAGAEALFLVGAEPDHLWRAFSTAVVDLAHELNVRDVVGLGAYPAPVPHSRPVRVVATSTDAERASRVGMVLGRVDVPAGVHAAIEAEASEAGLPSLGLWAQIPHYAAAMPYPEGADALVAALGDHVGLSFRGGDHGSESAATRNRLDELVADNDEHRAMLHQLETQYDAAEGLTGPLPTGDDLAAEVERFLRDQD